MNLLFSTASKPWPQLWALRCVQYPNLCTSFLGQGLEGNYTLSPTQHLYHEEYVGIISTETVHLPADFQHRLTSHCLLAQPFYNAPTSTDSLTPQTTTQIVPTHAPLNCTNGDSTNLWPTHTKTDYHPSQENKPSQARKGQAERTPILRPWGVWLQGKFHFWGSALRPQPEGSGSISPPSWALLHSLSHSFSQMQSRRLPRGANNNLLQHPGRAYWSSASHW